MAYEPKPGQFSLFRNNKDGNEARPDYTGNGADLDGNPIRIAAWIKEGKSGKFMSCKISMDEREAQKPKPASDGIGGVTEMDDDIPF